MILSMFNTCCFSSLSYAIFDAREYVVEQAIVLRLKSSLLCEYFCYKYNIRFASNIMSDNLRNKGEHNRLYKLHQRGK